MQMSGNATVDKLYGLEITGNVIPQNWFQTIVNDKGRPMANAIMILGEILYWYRPTEERDERDLKVSRIRKKFSGDTLQMSYRQLEQKFSLTRNQVKAAILVLEKLGVIQRSFRNLVIRGTKVNNVMYIHLNPDRLIELTFPEKADATYSGKATTSVKKTTEVCTSINSGIAENDMKALQKNDTGEEEKQRTNTKNTIEITNKDYLSIYQAAEKSFKAQIEYGILKLDHPNEMDLVDDMVGIAADIIVSPKKNCRVNGEEIAMARVQERFKMINFLTMKYILESLHSSTTEVKNVRAMLITAMYNAPVTMETHYNAKVRHDLAKKR